jgi:flagella basal body P-ring formation protein FlgA
MRILLSLLAAALFVVPPAAAEEAPAAAAPPVEAVLKASSHVAGAHVVLGDLFEGSGARAGDVVAAAPAPGGTMTFTASWLSGIAQSHGLVWHPTSKLANIQVTRDSTEVTSADVARRVAKALDLERPDRRVVMDTNMRLAAPADAPLVIDVQHLNYDQETARFTGDIAIQGMEAPAPIRISGRVDTLVELVVLGRNVMPGDVIRAEDVGTTWIRAELAPPGGVTDPQTLIGKTPRRPLRANVPFRPGDVEQPIVIRRNDLVLIVLERPGMYLTAQGKALEDGGQGSVIRVANTQSSRTVDAVVLGAGKVAVTPPSIAQATY